MFYNFSKFVDFPIYERGQQTGLFEENFFLFTVVNVSVVENVYICTFKKTKLN
jgi:hypothetical protein